MDTTYESSYVTSTADPAASAAMAGFMMVFWLIYFVMIALIVVSMWKLFTKANKPGWAAIVPIYNNLVMLEIIGRPWWWLLLMFVPILNWWIAIVIVLDFAKAYGKSVGYGVFMILLGIVAYPMLAFSKDTNYVGPVAAGYDGFGPAPDRAPQAQAPVAQPPVPPAAPQQ